jgi:CRISPR-associated protein Csb2
MDRYLCIAMTFLAEKYHGKEWPPAPARLFQALLAGVHTGSYRQHWPKIESTLRAIETLSAPEMLVRTSRLSSPYRIAVPNNDSDVAGREWRARREFDAAKLKTMKTIAPRTFIGMPGCAPHVYYIWPFSQTDIPEQTVQQLTSFLHTFGWGIDMAFADSSFLDERRKQKLVSQPGYSHYKPAEKGKTWTVPSKGYLDDLISTYKRQCTRRNNEGVDAAIRSRGYGESPYLRVGVTENPRSCFVLRELRNENVFFKVPWGLGMRVAAWMRHAAATALREEGYRDDFVNSYVLGHGHGHGRHMSFVPVPTIRRAHGDGAIRRVMLVEPPDADGFITGLLQRKMATTELLTLVNGSQPKPVCVLADPEKQDFVFSFYLQEATLWESVTPVVLHGYNSAQGKFSLKKTEQLLYQAFDKSGYSRQQIAELYFQPAPFWAGTEGALQIRVPEYLNKWPRYHVSVRFKEPVSGPVLVGIGRHYGIGLFAAPSESDRKGLRTNDRLSG